MIHRWRMFAFRTGTVLMFATAILLPASAAFADPVTPLRRPMACRGLRCGTRCSAG